MMGGSVLHRYELRSAIQVTRWYHYESGNTTTAKVEYYSYRSTYIVPLYQFRHQSFLSLPCLVFSYRSRHLKCRRTIKLKADQADEFFLPVSNTSLLFDFSTSGFVRLDD